MTQRSMFFIRSLRSRRDELRGHLVALFVEHADQHVEHALVFAQKTRDGLLDQPERFSISALLMCLTQILS